MKLRPLADIVGFAHTAEQMDAVMKRIGEMQGSERSWDTAWRVAISPHDDYTYTGHLYPALLERVRAKTIIFFGVAHKAKHLGLENQLIFDSYSHWRGPYGDVQVSSIREEIMETLPEAIYQVNDTMQELEHSVEAIVPFLQHYNRNVEIVSILVPAMPYGRMEEIARGLAEVIGNAAGRREWKWGDDYAIVISTDAVHYGDEEWGGRDFARFGTDTTGYREAVAYEHLIIDTCLAGEVAPEKIRRFTEHTVEKEDFREYRWTWCGRYSVPCGLLTAYHLQRHLDVAPLSGELIGYGTSIDGREHIPVEDLGMGVTAPAHLRHWVGYASVGYR